VHAVFRGMQAFMARKKGRCKLIGNRFVITHDTMPSTVTSNPPSMKISMNILDKAGIVEYPEKLNILGKIQNILSQFSMVLSMNKVLQGINIKI